MADDVEQKQVTLRLTTRLPARYRVPAHPLAVPARLTRYGLSEVVNSLLKLGARTHTHAVHGAVACASRRDACGSAADAPHAARRAARADAPVPFDFLINDELVQTPLETFIVQRGISAVRARRARAPAAPPSRGGYQT